MLRWTSGAVALLIILAACGGTPPSTGAPQVTLPPLPTLPGGQPPGSLTPDQALEDLFPVEIGGRPLDVRSATGESIYDLFPGGDDEDLDDLLAEIGTSFDNVSTAIALSFGPGATEDEVIGISIIALRVRNVPSANVLSTFAAVVQRDEPDTVLGSATIAGKNLTTLAEPDDARNPTYLYAVGDVVFMVGGTPELVTETFTKLP
ncbi:MAG TPA: hypothetical protein VMP67_00905 [Candidatus Limnocylindria bacterium]|nr:hypothetical protein [Candidatus Limnocylindria bacterium]